MRYTESMKKADKMKGFTIIELMITLVVAAVLLSVGVPSFNQMIKSNRLESAAREFAASFDLARAEAIARGTWVSVCKCDVAGGSPYTCADPTDGNWDQGWIVFTDDGPGDPDNDRDNGEFDSGETLIRVQGAPSVGVTIVGTSNGDDGNPYLGVDTFVTLSRFGRRLDHEDRATRRQLGKVSICDDRDSESGWELEIKENGQLIKKKMTCS